MNNGLDFTNNFELNSRNLYWNKYDKIIQEMSLEQRNFVGKNKEVLQAKQNLISAFIDYLFEQNKTTFIMASENAKTLADNYLTAIENAAKSFVTRSDELEKENSELKKQVQQLLFNLEELNGKNKTAAK